MIGGRGCAAACTPRNSAGPAAASATPTRNTARRSIILSPAVDWLAIVPSLAFLCSVIYRSPGPAACRDELAGDRPGLFRGQEDRDERDLRSVHHAADGIASRRVRSEVLPLRIFRGYAQLGGAGSEQARRALGAGRAGMDAFDRDPMTAQLDC